MTTVRVKNFYYDTDNPVKDYSDEQLIEIIEMSTEEDSYFGGSLYQDWLNWVKQEILYRMSKK